MRRLLFVSAIGLATACSLTTSFDGLSGGPDDAPPPDAAADTAVTDAAADTDATPTDGTARPPPDGGPPLSCTTIGPRYPTAEGQTPFSPSSNVEASDGNAAETILTASSPLAAIETYAYGFTVPAAAAIAGVQIAVRRKSDTPNQVLDHSVLLRQSGTSLDRANDTPWPASFETMVFGAPNDTWGVPLTAAIVNGNDFGAKYTAKYAAPVGNEHGKIDSIGIIVTYCE